MFAASVTGDKQFDRRLRQLPEKVQKKLAKASLTAGLRVLVKAIKAEIPSTWKEGRKAIGQRVTRGKAGASKGIHFSKAGVGVGLRKSKKAAVARKKGKGVGIGATNFHWFILGTEDRWTGSKRVGAHRKGRINPRTLTGNPVAFRGRMRANNLVKRGAAKAGTSSIAKVKQSLSEGINREWAKK